MLYAIYFWLTYLVAVLVICYVLVYCWFRRKDLYPVGWDIWCTNTTIMVALCPVLNLFIASCLVGDFISLDSKPPDEEMDDV